MNCRSCGAPLSPGARFCDRCGAAVGGRPSRDEIRARLGGGRHAAPSRGAAAARHAAPGRNRGGNDVPGRAGLFLTAAGILWLLQLVYLNVRTLFINMSYGDFTLGNASFSVLGALKEGGSTAVGVLLVLVCLAGLLSLILPKLLLGRRLPVLTGLMAGLSMALLIFALVKIRSAFDKTYFGVEPTMGLFVWLLLLNCLLIGALAFLAVREGEPDPAPVAPRRPASTRTAPVRSGSAPQRAPAPARPSASQRNVAPPDAETVAALRRMAEMHRQGLVSDAEFARIKAECVARGWIRE